MSIKFFVGTDKRDGEEVVALKHGDHYHVAANDDGDTVEQVGEWLKANADVTFVLRSIATWPERAADEVTDLKLAYELDVE